MQEGYAAREREYDDNGNVITERYYDEKDDRTICRGGYAEVRKEYNGNSQVIWEMYYTTDGTPAVLRDNYSAREREYDVAGNNHVKPLQKSLI